MKKYRIKEVVKNGQSIFHAQTRWFGFWRTMRAFAGYEWMAEYEDITNAKICIDEDIERDRKIHNAKLALAIAKSKNPNKTVIHKYP